MIMDNSHSHRHRSISRCVVCARYDTFTLVIERDESAQRRRHIPTWNNDKQLDDDIKASHTVWVFSIRFRLLSENCVVIVYEKLFVSRKMGRCFYERKRANFGSAFGKLRSGTFFRSLSLSLSLSLSILSLYLYICQFSLSLSHLSLYQFIVINSRRTCVLSTDQPTFNDFVPNYSYRRREYFLRRLAGGGQQQEQNKDKKMNTRLRRRV